MRNYIHMDRQRKGLFVFLFHRCYCPATVNGKLVYQHMLNSIYLGQASGLDEGKKIRSEPFPLSFIIIIFNVVI